MFLKRYYVTFTVPSTHETFQAGDVIPWVAILSEVWGMKNNRMRSYTRFLCFYYFK